MKFNMKLLVTGGSGMVGRNILEHPDASKWNILHPQRNDLDLTKADLVEKYLIENKPYMVIHAAGLVGSPQENLDNPVRFLDENMIMGRNIIMASFKSGVKSFLNISSNNIYPVGTKTPMSEDQLLSGQLEKTNEGYSLAKLVCLKLCEYISSSNKGFNYKTLVPCNMYGKFDKYDSLQSNLMAAIIMKVHNAKLKNLSSVKIWGDGKARREFLFVGDMVEAIWKATQNMDTLPGMMNIGVGQDMSVQSYYELIARIINWKGKFEFDLSKPVGMKRKLCSYSRQKSWGWSPKTSLMEGLRITYASYLSDF